MFSILCSKDSLACHVCHDIRYQFSRSLLKDPVSSISKVIVRPSQGLSPNLPHTEQALYRLSYCNRHKFKFTDQTSLRDDVCNGHRFKFTDQSMLRDYLCIYHCNLHCPVLVREGHNLNPKLSHTEQPTELPLWPQIY